MSAGGMGRSVGEGGREGGRGRGWYQREDEE